MRCDLKLPFAMITEESGVPPETQFPMSRQAQHSASAQALQTAAPTPRRLTADSLGRAGASDTLAKLNSAIGELKALSAAPLLQRAVEAIRAEDAKAGCDWALKALELDEQSGFGWYLLGSALERAGDFANSIAAYESALKLLPDHAEIANDLGRLAFRLGMPPQAEDLFRHFLARHPDHPEGANNLACAIRDQGRHGEAIEILRPAIVKSPEIAMLWNTMGTVVADQGDFVNALVFFEEALRLDPAFPKARYNLGNAKLLLGDAEGAIVDCEAAMRGVLAEDERQMMRLGPMVRLIVAVETRLTPMFQRAFPQAEIGAHGTYILGGRLARGAPFLDADAKFDFWTPIGSLLREFRRSVEAYPARDAYMAADPARIAYWREILEAEAPKGPKVGHLWKSAVSRDSRHRYFSPFATWEPVLAQK